MDPWAGPPGYDAVVQAMCGLGSVNGDRASGPLRMGVPIVDLSTGPLNVAIRMALVERERSGKADPVYATQRIQTDQAFP